MPAVPNLLASPGSVRRALSWDPNSKGFPQSRPFWPCLMRYLWAGMLEATTAQPAESASSRERPKPSEKLEVKKILAP